MAARDDAILLAAAGANLTLVTYDQRTIVPLLVEWGLAGVDHTGVISVDNKAIPPHDFGALVR